MRIESNISDLQGISTDRTESPSSANKARTASTEESESFPEDTVSISTLTAKALQSPEVRQDKVDSLQQSVSNGEYQIEPSAIAAAMVGEA
jgi:flagellar biosynthesis anti-sigma factor FlgM